MNAPNENDLTVVCPVSFRRVESGHKRLKAGPEEPLPKSASIPRVAKLMALALRFEKLVAEGLVENYADLARLGGVSCARMSQILNLLNLAPDIQEELLFLKKTPGGREPVTEFELRDLVAEVEWGTQRRAWEEMMN
ncbi:MAG: hypothetical protein PHQ12_08110 [Chthoniobacteraceae bacterium]|jgi:hypothetical protein|nr:hypothetical protein [Chthoniobacteraceae bacterium]